jgi:hypothetical protein
MPKKLFHTPYKLSSANADPLPNKLINRAMADVRTMQVSVEEKIVLYKLAIFRNFF